MWTGGPPRWDYTRIKGEAALEKSGAEGVKFELMSLPLQAVEAILQFALLLLVENVDPSSETEPLFFDDVLSCKLDNDHAVARHYMISAGDFKRSAAKDSGGPGQTSPSSPTGPCLPQPTRLHECSYLEPNRIYTTFLQVVLLFRSLSQLPELCCLVSPHKQ